MCGMMRWRGFLGTRRGPEVNKRFTTGIRSKGLSNKRLMKDKDKRLHNVAYWRCYCLPREARTGASDSVRWDIGRPTDLAVRVLAPVDDNYNKQKIWHCLTSNNFIFVSVVTVSRHFGLIWCGMYRMMRWRGFLGTQRGPASLTTYWTGRFESLASC